MNRPLIVIGIIPIKRRGYCNGKDIPPDLVRARRTLAALAYELYGLTEEEIAIVEGALGSRMTPMYAKDTKVSKIRLSQPQD